MWWSSSNINNNNGGSSVARMLVRMISSQCNLIKCYHYAMDCPSWAPVMMMMMILSVENHFVFVEF